MNKKTILALVAIVATLGLVIAASSIVTPLALALKLVGGKDTKSNPNSAEVRCSQESDSVRLHPH
jgi:hypothetical protein